MNNQNVVITPEQIIEIVLRRRWLIIIPLCFSLLGGIVHAIRTPSIYESRTLILVQPQKVPANYVQSLVSTDINSRISTIRQMIMSRTNLEKIIEKFSLFANNKGMFMEDKVAGIAKQINVSGTRGRGSTDSFAISFRGKDPRTVMNIANDLAAFVIDENLKVREAQALGTSVFLDSELEQMLKRLESHEDALKEYRERYMGGLPQQLDSNLKILDRLQEQYAAREASLRDARGRLAIVESQMRRDRRRALEARALAGVPKISGDGKTVYAAPAESEDEIRLKQMKEHHRALLGKYTARHPDVVSLVKQIALLEAGVARATREKIVEGPPETSPGVDEQKGNSGVYEYDPVQYQENLAMKNEIRVNKDDIGKILKQIAHYQQLVEDTPKREQELLSLNRNYQNIKKTYDSLLARKLEAQIAVNMEKKQKGEQFRILDFARVAQKPISPDLKKIMILALAAGLGAGGGIIFVLEYLNSAFRRPDEIESLFGIPVIATIPRIGTPADARKKRLNVLLTLVGLLCMMGILAVFAVLVIKGVDPTIAFAKKLVGR